MVITYGSLATSVGSWVLLLWIYVESGLLHYVEVMLHCKGVHLIKLERYLYNNWVSYIMSCIPLISASKCSTLVGETTATSFSYIHKRIVTNIMLTYSSLRQTCSLVPYFLF